MQNSLEIFIITYNRKGSLEHTLKIITSENSPIKNCQITILNNNSDDGTSELCNDFANKYENIIHIKHNKNIGLGENICRAMEYACKEYFWILCDNDELDFSAWKEVEVGIKDNVDIIVVSQIFKFCNARNEIEKFAYKLAGCMFLPGCIYKTSNINDFVMTYMMQEIPTCLPHMALVYETVNNNGLIAETSKNVVNILKNEDYFETHDRIGVNRKHYSLKNGYTEMSINYLNSLKILNDKDLKQTLINISIAGEGFGYINLKQLSKFYAEGKINTPEVLTILKELSFRHKRKFARLLVKYKLKRLFTNKERA